MENTSNALIMAGEILIGILVLSLLAYIVIEFGSFSKDMHDTMSETQIVQFNSNFTTYSNRVNITAHEIVTAINFAKQANDSKDLIFGDTSDYYTTVYIDDVNVFSNNFMTKDDYENNVRLERILNDFIKKNNIIYFSCNAILDKKKKITYNENDIVYNEQTRQVSEIHFHSISPEIITIPEHFTNE